jgi:hypothetical protein
MFNIVSRATSKTSITSFLISSFALSLFKSFVVVSSSTILINYGFHNLATTYFLWCEHSCYQCFSLLHLWQNPKFGFIWLLFRPLLLRPLDPPCPNGGWWLEFIP